MSASTRFCPFCGQSNESDYAFCMKCGKQLPPLAPTQHEQAGGLPVPPPPSDVPPEDPYETISERPLSQEEIEGLKRVQKSPVIGGARVFATLFGIAPLFLVFMAFMGTPFDPVAFPAVMLGSGFIAMIAGAVCMSKRYPAAYVIARGTVQEARGVPKKTYHPGGQVKVRLGAIEITTTAGVAGRLQDGTMNVLVILPSSPGLQGAASQKSWIVSVNGVVLKSPATCTITPIPGSMDVPPPPPPEFVYGGK